MVSLSEFEAKYENFEKSLRRTPILANRKASALRTDFGKSMVEVETLDSTKKKAAVAKMSLTGQKST